MIKQKLKSLIRSAGYEICRATPPASAQLNSVPGDPWITSPWYGSGEFIPDRELYHPLFSPWLGEREFRKAFQIAEPRTLVSADRCYVIWILLRQAVHLNGDIWECGVYRGGTAAMMAAVLQNEKAGKRLVLFDTFEGMPQTDPKQDWHKQGEFRDTSADGVASYVGYGESCVIRKGYIPDTFIGLESAQIAFVHVDLDIYKSILDTLKFVWPRLSVGGFVVFDDYGFPTCPGARTAVDEFFASKTCIPLCLPTGQAVVFKGAV